MRLIRETTKNAIAGCWGRSEARGWIPTLTRAATTEEKPHPPTATAPVTAAAVAAVAAANSEAPASFRANNARRSRNTGGEMARGSSRNSSWRCDAWRPSARHYIDRSEKNVMGGGRPRVSSRAATDSNVVFRFALRHLRGPHCCFGRMSDAAEIQAERGRGRQPQQLLKMRDIARIGLIIRILL